MERRGITTSLAVDNRTTEWSRTLLHRGAARIFTSLPRRQSRGGRTLDPASGSGAKPRFGST